MGQQAGYRVIVEVSLPGMAWHHAVPGLTVDFQRAAQPLPHNAGKPLRRTPHPGGSGEFQGGMGVKRAYKFLSPATVTINSDRREIPPYGLHGGAPGQVGSNKLLHKGQEIELDSKVSIQIQSGDILVIETPGGGGWGKRTK